MRDGDGDVIGVRYGRGYEYGYNNGIWVLGGEESKGEGWIW